jgi:hypothetical protein
MTADAQALAPRQFQNLRSALRLPTLSRPHISVLLVKIFSALNIGLRAWDRARLGLA